MLKKGSAGSSVRDEDQPTPPGRRTDESRTSNEADRSDQDVENLQPVGPPVDEAEANFQPKSIKFWATLVSLFLSLFIVALDRTIISTASPQITVEFQSLGDIGWYGSAYQLTTSACQLVFGRVYRFYDIKTTFFICLFIFEAGSAICGAAPNSIAFIMGRAIAGLGSAGMFSGVMVIMVPLIPLRKRAMFQGAFGAVFGIASVMGPLVGGLFTDSVTWRWCFYMNLPIGAFAAICLAFCLRLPKKKLEPAPLWTQLLRLDPLGTFFFIPSVVALLLALEWGGSKYQWSDPRIIGVLSAFGALWVAFCASQYLNPKNATVPKRIIGQRSILMGAIFMFCLSGSMMMMMYFLPLWFQVVQGVSATKSGIYTLPLVISMVIGSVLNGIITQKLGYYVPAMITSPSIMAVGLGLMSTFRVLEDRSHWISYQVLGGFGLGIGMQSAGLAAQAVLPKPDIPMGISIMFFAQQLGGAIFTSVGQNLLSTTLISQLSGLSGASPSSITGVGATDIVSQFPDDKKAAVLDIYNRSLTQIFLCAMGVAIGGTVAALCMEWKNLKKVGPPRPAVKETEKGKSVGMSETEPTTGASTPEPKLQAVGRMSTDVETVMQSTRTSGEKPRTLVKRMSADVETVMHTARTSLDKPPRAFLKRMSTATATDVETVMHSARTSLDKPKAFFGLDSEMHSARTSRAFLPPEPDTPEDISVYATPRTRLSVEQPGGWPDAYFESTETPGQRQPAEDPEKVSQEVEDQASKNTKNATDTKNKK